MLTTVKVVESDDGMKRPTVYSRPDGQGSFVEESWESDEDFGTGELYSYWSPTFISGIYETPEAAEADARETLPWLRNRISD